MMNKYSFYIKDDNGKGVYFKDIRILDNHIQKLVESGPAGEIDNAVSASWITVNAQLEHFDYVLSGWLESLDTDRRNNTIFIITSDNGSVHGDMKKRKNNCFGECWNKPW